jgi:hypothetical protein
MAESKGTHSIIDAIIEAKLEEFALIEILMVRHNLQYRMVKDNSSILAQLIQLIATPS